MSIQQELQTYLLSEVAVDKGKPSLDPDTDLLQQGIIDSLGIMNLVLFMEKSFGVKVDDEEILPENFQTLKSIVAFVERKKQRG